MHSVPQDADRDFTASAFVVSDDRQVLLVNHRKLGRWLQPGGHIESGELPDETAVREVSEETSVSIDILDVTGMEGIVPQSRPRPWDVNVHQIRDGHWHCDFTYLATPVTIPESHDSDEHNGAEWFSAGELGVSEVTADMRTRAEAAIRAVTDRR